MFYLFLFVNALVFAIFLMASLFRDPMAASTP